MKINTKGLQRISLFTSYFLFLYQISINRIEIPQKSVAQGVGSKVIS